MKKIICFYTILSFLILPGCKGFLTEVSQNLAYVETVKDLEELLIGEVHLQNAGFDPEPPYGNWSLLASHSQHYFPFIHVLDDDVDEFAVRLNTSAFLNWPRAKFMKAYCWQPDPFMDSGNNAIKDQNWTLFYKRIAVINSIIFQLKEIRDEEEDQELVLRVEGEAHFLRARYYLWLVNLYAHPYVKATAATDPGIPLKVTENVEDIYFSRTPMKQIYDQITADLEQAAVCLENVKQKNVLRVSYGAACALLSRVYLYMEEYAKAIESADKVLGLNNYQLLDYNELSAGSSVTFAASSETIFNQGGYTMGVFHSDDKVSGIQANSFTTSSDLLDSYEESDLRREFFFKAPQYTTTARRCLKYRNVADGYISDVWLIRLPEVYLNKAEAEAALGIAEATRTIQELRTRRFSPENLKPVTQTGDELIDFIRDERRRELCFEAHRWFDLRRYAVNAVRPYLKAIVHNHLEFEPSISVTEGYYYIAGTYTLKPYPEDKSCWLLPIPEDTIDFNKGNITNDIRPEREMMPIN